MEDLHAVYTRVTGRRSFPKAWAKRAVTLENMAQSAEANGRIVTAHQLYHRAALCHGRAQHLIPVHGNAQKEDSYRALYRCYDKVIDLSNGMMEKVSPEFAPGQKTSLDQDARLSGLVVQLPIQRKPLGDRPEGDRQVIHIGCGRAGAKHRTHIKVAR